MRFFALFLLSIAVPAGVYGWLAGSSALLKNSASPQNFMKRPHQIAGRFQIDMNVALLDGPPTPRRLALAKIAQEEAEQRKKLIRTRGVKLAVFLALGIFSIALGGPSPSLLGKVAAGSILCTAGGLYDGHLAVSYGYGLSLIWQAAVFLPLARSPWSASSALLLAYALYGIKVCIFQGLRDASPAYVAKALEPQRAKAVAKSKGSTPAVGFSTSRAPMAIGVGLLLTTFAFPLHAATSLTVGAAAAASGAATSGAATAANFLITCGGMLAIGGLLFQTIADAQKFTLKRTSLCLTL